MQDPYNNRYRAQIMEFLHKFDDSEAILTSSLLCIFKIQFGTGGGVRQDPPPLLGQSPKNNTFFLTTPLSFLSCSQYHPGPLSNLGGQAHKLYL